jgi:ABC-type dipeptide/oligopeptide/nickel transport system permease component
VADTATADTATIVAEPVELLADEQKLRADSNLGAWLRGQRWWITRLLMLPVHLFVFAIGIFFLVRLIPGDPILTITGGQLDRKDYAAARVSLGLNGSLVQQLGRYLDNLVHGDLGRSLKTRTSVLHDIGALLPATIELAILALVLALVLTVVLGQLSVSYPRSFGARVINAYGRTAGAIPDFVLGVAAIFLCYATLHIAPAPLGIVGLLQTQPSSVTGFPLIDALIAGNISIFGSEVQHLTLPILVMSLTYTPMMLKIYLRSLAYESDAPATYFRVATGARRRVILASAARRALPPIIAVTGAVFGYLLGGAVVIEQLFGMPGLGQYAVNAVTTDDLVALQGFLVIVAAVSMVMFLFVDIVTMALDPRRRPGTAGGDR